MSLVIIKNVDIPSSVSGMYVSKTPGASLSYNKVHQLADILLIRICLLSTRKHSGFYTAWNEKTSPQKYYLQTMDKIITFFQFFNLPIYMVYPSQHDKHKLYGSC